MNWQPIATAPKDGQRIVAGYWHLGLWRCFIMFWFPDLGGYWTHGQPAGMLGSPPSKESPTHWIELPEPPPHV